MQIISTTHWRPRWYGDVAALIYGACLPLAFSPFNLWVLAILLPALLLVLWLNASPARAFLRGGLFGSGFFSVGVSWIYISLHVYGQANVVVAVIITILFIGFLALYLAVNGYLLSRFFPLNTLSKCLLVFPSLWVLLEWLRAWVFTGFPWLYLGYTQLNTPLSSLAPITSVYGVSWAVAFTSGLLVVCLLTKKLKIIFSMLGLLFTLWLVTYILSTITWTQPSGNALGVSLIQGDIPQEMKWQEQQAVASFTLYKNLTQQHLDSQLIIWPEAAITFTQAQAQPYLDELEKILKPRHVSLISGIPIVQDNRYYNGMIALGDGKGMYLKRHLVPFGEFMPLRGLLVWLRDYLQIPMSDFSRGPKKQPLITVAGIPVGATVCYEVAYPSEVADALPQSQLLVTLSDDSWFGESLAPAQHVQMAQMRALETGRYLLMSTNNAITAIINAQGRVQSFALPYQKFVLTDQVQPMVGSTPWIKMGIYPWFLLLGLMLALGVIGQKEKRKTTD